MGKNWVVGKSVKRKTRTKKRIKSRQKGRGRKERGNKA